MRLYAINVRLFGMLALILAMTFEPYVDTIK